MFAEICRKNILALAEAYAEAVDTGLPTVSMRAYGNGTFLREFAARRRSISVDAYGNMLVKIHNIWPDNVPWPDLEPIYFTRENVVKRRHVLERKRKR